MKKFFLFAVAFATLSLVSCSGGDGSSTQQDTTAPAGDPVNNDIQSFDGVEDTTNAQTTEDTTATESTAQTDQTGQVDPNATKTEPKIEATQTEPKTEPKTEENKSENNPAAPNDTTK